MPLISNWLRNNRNCLCLSLTNRYLYAKQLFFILFLFSLFLNFLFPLIATSLQEKKFTRLRSTKSMLVVNDIFPGPEIRAHKGDTVFVNVDNQGYILWCHNSLVLCLSQLIYIHLWLNFIWFRIFCYIIWCHKCNVLFLLYNSPSIFILFY